MAPKLCRSCETSKMQIKNPNVVLWICTRSGRHKNFADTCDYTKDQTHPHPILGTLDIYIEAARCKTLDTFQQQEKPQQ